MLHAGAAELYRRCVGQLASSSAFTICHIIGPEGSGKTHFSVKLAEEFSTRGVTVRVYEGALAEAHAAASSPPGQRSLFLIDDIDCYFEQAADSGEFISLVEKLRLTRAALALFSRRSAAELKADEHARSRIRPGEGFVMGPPGEEDLPLLVATMARQRGMLLSPRKIEFLARRVPRDIRAIAAALDQLSYVQHASGSASSFRTLDELAPGGGRLQVGADKEPDESR